MTGRRVEGGRQFLVLFPGQEKPGQVSRLQRGPSQQGRDGEGCCMEPGLEEGRDPGVRLRAEGSTWRRGPVASDGAVARGWPRLQAEGRWSLVRCGHSGLLFPSPWAWLCFFVLLFLQVAVETYGRHVPPQSSAARFQSPDEAVSVFPGLLSALRAVGAPLGVPGRPLTPCTENNEERGGG